MIGNVLNTENSVTENKKRKSIWSDVFRRFKKNKPAMIGIFILTILVLVAIFADIIVDYDLTMTGRGTDRMLGPSSEHWFGTDHMGRDIFARIVHGSRISLSIGIFATGIALVLGSIIGAATGYYGGLFDNIVMRVLDVINCVPSTLLVMAFVAALGANMKNLLIAMTIGAIPGIARLVRSTIISIADMEYIEAAKAYGTSSYKIIIKHVLPNAMGTIIITGAGMVASTILMAAAMSFIGFGVQPPTAEWGVMLSDARAFMREAPYMVLFPGGAIVISALSINLIGDGLRDALDPRLKD